MGVAGDDAGTSIFAYDRKTGAFHVLGAMIDSQSGLKLYRPHDLQVTDDELCLTLAPLSSPHRTRAVEALCELLNDTATTFPGSKLRLRFAVQPPPRIGLAFPGPAASRQPDAPAQGL